MAVRRRKPSRKTPAIRAVAKIREIFKDGTRLLTAGESPGGQPFPLITCHPQSRSPMHGGSHSRGDKTRPWGNLGTPEGISAALAGASMAALAGPAPCRPQAARRRVLASIRCPDIRTSKSSLLRTVFSKWKSDQILHSTGGSFSLECNSRTSFPLVGP